MQTIEVPPTTPSTRNSWPVLVAFLALVVGGGVLIGFLTAPGDWYADLQKPAFNPPNWIFGPVWTALYVLIAVAGWRTWSRRSTSSAMTAWWAQLVLNFSWSPAFFGLQQVGVALIIIAALLASIIAFIALSWRRDRTSALLFVPYAVWVGFATLLNASIYVLN